MIGADMKIQETWWRDPGMVQNQVLAEVPPLDEISVFSGEGAICRQCGYGGMENRLVHPHLRPPSSARITMVCKRVVPSRTLGERMSLKGQGLLVLTE